MGIPKSRRDEGETRKTRLKIGPELRQAKERPVLYTCSLFRAVGTHVLSYCRAIIIARVEYYNSSIAI